MSQPDTQPDPAPRSVNPWTIWIPIIIIMLGGVVFYNYLWQQSMKRDKDRPPYLGRLENDLELTERSGKSVHLAELRGKVIIAGYVYTRCPRGCALVVSKMKKLYEEFGADPAIQFISFTVDPEDTPQTLAEFAGRFGITQDNWWFVNGPKEQVRGYLTFQFKFAGVKEIPEAERFNPDDKYIHDMKVALVDHKGNVRGHYDIANMDPEYEGFWKEKIRQDLKWVLAEQKSGK
ncbi:MAG: SCO family protein [Verrucomicrobiaceae bacterium]|nr:SCO family protein [Verrucomicrobiaceae bacterium]